MAQLLPFLVFALAFTGFTADAKVVERTFNVGNMTIRRLCKTSVITAVNGRLPGPAIYVNEGDTVIVHIINESPYNMTLHWHGVFQRLTPWADGPNMITQCPVQPGNRYTYNFTITGQEGTLWWHAHVSFLRATVYGALIIRPREGVKAYPFPNPYKEVPIILGEWWNANIVAIEQGQHLTGAPSNISDAFTINAQPGDLYPCSTKHTFKLEVECGKTYMLRIICAALNGQLFFKIAGHSFTVVAVDASYTTPYATDVLVLGPGQTVDVLMTASAPPGSYYMAARPYNSAGPLSPAPFDNTTATGILRYKEAPAPPSSKPKPPPPPVMPAMPSFFDTATAFGFSSNLTALLGPSNPTVPLKVDVPMFVTIGLCAAACGPTQLLCNRSRGSLAAGMNNVSFQFPTKMSILEAHYRGVPGVYTPDFPDYPPVFFDFTNVSLIQDPGQLLFTTQATKTKRVKYNSVVEIVFQNTALIGPESHPVHLHGYNFFVLAQGFGNYNPATAPKSYNLVNPHLRNTIAVPAGGWAVIRFLANNPGTWIMHCHFDDHLGLGFATVFEVEDGPTPDSILPPPPPDYPKC